MGSPTYKCIIGIGLFLVCSLFLVTACQKSPKYRIGVSQCSNDDWRQQLNDEIEREGMYHDDVIIEVRSADDSSQKQIDDLRYFVESGCDIIVVSPNEAESLTPVIAEIYQSGIPVLIFDRSVNGDDFTAYIGADNTGIGVGAASLAYSMLGSGGKVLEIRGLDGSTPADDRGRGFHKRAAELGLEIIGSGEGNWNPSDGKRVADSLLHQHPDANLIFAHNDRMAIAASEAARHLGLNNIKVIGVDAAPTIGIQAVADSIIDASFVYPTAGHELIATALAILNGENYEREQIFPAVAPVDRSNAEILLMQDRIIRNETGKISQIKSQLEIYWEQHKVQTTLLYSVMALTLMAGGIIFLLLRAYWTKQRHHEQIERQNQELARQRDELDQLYHHLEEATGSKLSFFTNVSHDLRTPLTLIADPVHQLSQASNLTPQQHTLMALADKNVKRLERLINQILDIRKFDNGQLALHMSNVDMASLVSDWASQFEQAARSRHTHFAVAIAPNCNYTTAIDVEKMERVFFNLLSNALKFTPSNGSINVSLFADDSTISLAVADTGRGINAEEIKHIFDRFFKTDHINPNGSGIGLALSKTFVEMHGGSIVVESKPGKGTTFTITLPVTHVEESADVGDVIASSIERAHADIEELTDVDTENISFDEKSPLVLIIDDNSDIRTLVATLLSDHYNVLQAASGVQGIRLASKFIPDLIVCDVMMPGIDGYETCRRLKRETVTSHIPVLLLTACSLDEQRTQGYECGVDGYLSKPFDSAMFLSRCNALIENRRRIYDNLGSATLTKPATVIEQPVQSPASQGAGDIDDEFYRRFMKIVEEKLHNSDLSVEDIASDLGLSRVQMYRKIKALTNYSPAELLRNVRLHKADRLLKTTSMTVSEVGYAVGFTTPSYFTKCYREFFNEAPSEVQGRTSKARE